MDVTLMHNPKAGAKSWGKKELIRGFERAGHKVGYFSTKKEGSLRAFDHPGNLVVIAGGDGTVRKVARRLIGRNVPVAILPLGTANNVARALGLDTDLERIIEGLAKARSVKFDVGIARGPWGDVPFFEAAGAGLFPSMMTDIRAKADEGAPEAEDAEEGVEGAVRFMQQMLDRFHGREFVIKLDSRELTGKYLLVEAMNIPTIGPAVELAPNANPGDGLLDVALVPEHQRHELDRHLATNSQKRKSAIFTVHRTRHLRLSCSAADFHFDDESWPGKPDEKSHERKPVTEHVEIEIGVFPGALRVLIPQ